MEEEVGVLWHRLITRAAATSHAHAAVELEQVARSVGLLFRALGGDGGMAIKAAGATDYRARRGLLQRIAGTHRKVELAWRDATALYLPARLDLFPERDLNRELFLWLAALAASDDGSDNPWIVRNQRLTRLVLERYPGLAEIYRRLLAAHIAQRPAPEGLSPNEATLERAVRAALTNPGEIERLPETEFAPHPVILWLHPDPPASPNPTPAGTDPDDPEGGDSTPTAEAKQKRQRQAERVEMPDGNKGLVAMRMESIFSWADFVRVDRSTDEDEDLEKASAALEDMDRLSIARDNKKAASKLRFDLDLPSDDHDDHKLTDGILYPEWDWKKGRMLEQHCRIQPMVARDAEPTPLPPELNRLAKRLRSQFEALAPVRSWHRGQPEGSDIDLDAYLEFHADKRAGLNATQEGLYRELRGGGRDLACLLLADLSLSTDSWINNHGRVIDVIRDSLFLFAEALSATRDRFALFGFSSRKRSHVRFHLIKGFAEPYDKIARGRIQAIRPGYYTRMGAAIRHAADLLGREPAHQRLLLLLTDGKPNDLDRYEGRHGAEDTRMAIVEAKRKGLTPFCVTIDKDANDYLPHLFGPGGYVVIRKPEQLPKELPLLYARLTQG